jgi:tetratricopeptide (TPR) repeat protein
MADILKLESEIAQAIAGEISAKLTTSEKQRIDKTRPIDPRATEAFLLGRHYFNTWTKENEQKAVEQFTLATQLEPEYADAWAGLADAWTVLGMVGAIRMHEAEKPTKDATNRALEIDPDNSAANVSMCFVKNNYDFDWVEGERYCKKGIELNPNNPKARLAYAFLLARLERWDEVFPQMEQAVRIDPAEPWWRSVYGGYMIQTRRFEEAEKQLSIGHDIGPDSSHTIGALCDLYTEIGRYDDALKLAGTSPLQQARIYARMGEKEKALELLTNADQRDEYMLARVYAALGDKDRAFETLNRSLDQGNGFMGGTTVFLEFEILKSDPRWKALLQRMNR